MDPRRGRLESPSREFPLIGKGHLSEAEETQISLSLRRGWEEEQRSSQNSTQKRKHPWIERWEESPGLPEKPCSAQNGQVDTGRLPDPLQASLCPSEMGSPTRQLVLGFCQQARKHGGNFGIGCHPKLEVLTLGNYRKNT